MSNASDFSDGSAYEQLMGRWSRIAGRQFLAWCDDASGLEWLDVGCGNGAFTEAIIAQAEPRAVHGIDPAPGQIAYARQRADTPGAVFAVGDALQLPFADSSFDVVTMGLVIAFIPDPAAAVREMLRVARPGGNVHTYMWQAGQSPLAPMLRALREMGVPAGIPPSADVATEAGLRRLWEGAGLSEIATTRLVLDVRFAHAADFIGSLTLPFGPQAERLLGLSPAEKAELETRLLASVTIASDGSITYPAIANAVKGVVRGDRGNA